jgi:hypothetical protein
MFAAAPVLLGVSGVVQAQSPCAANLPPAATTAPGADAGALPAGTATHTEDSAVVEAAITGEQGGFRYRAYIADWRGYRILVRDELQRTDIPAGGNLHLLVMRHEIGDRRILDFAVLDGGPRQGDPSAKSAPMRTGTRAPMRASSLEQSGPIEDVLSAQLDGFRFRAYVVTLQGQSVPVFDTLSLSEHSIGEQIDVLGIRLDAGNGHGALADFQVQPDPRAIAQLRPAQSVRSVSSESGTIVEVLAAQSGDYRYRAYVVQWHGTRVIVPDPASQADYQAGDTLTFRSQRISGAAPVGSLLAFTMPDAQAAATSQQPAVPPASQQSVQETAAVAEVLQAQDGANRFQAYLIDWHGARVAVLDMFANSQLAVGQPVSFSVARVDAVGADPSEDRKQLAFMRFDFPRPTMKSAADSGCTATAIN